MATQTLYSPFKLRGLNISYAHIYVAGYILFTLNFEAVFHVSQFVLLTKVIMMLGACIALLAAQKLKFQFFCSILIIFVAAFSGIFTSYEYFSWGNWLRALNQLFVPLALLSIYPSKRDTKVILQGLAIAPVVCVLAGCIYDAAGLHRLLSAEYGSGILRLQGALIPAFLGAICVCGAVASLLLWISGQRVWLVVFLINSMLLILTAARMPIAVWAMVVAYLMLFQMRLTIPQKVGFIALFLSAGIAFLFTFGSSLLARASTSGASGRDILWRHYELLIRTYPDFGVGLGNSILTVPHQTSIQVGGVVAAHNEFLRIPAELGLAPSFIILALFLLIMSASWIQFNVKNALIPVSTAAFLMYCYTDNSIATPSNYPLLIAAVLGAMLIRPRAKRSGASNAAPPPRNLARRETGAEAHP